MPPPSPPLGWLLLIGLFLMIFFLGVAIGAAEEATLGEQALALLLIVPPLTEELPEPAPAVFLIIVLTAIFFAVVSAGVSADADADARGRCRVFDGVLAVLGVFGAARATTLPSTFMRGEEERLRGRPP